MERRTERQTRTMGCRFETREENSERRIEGYFNVFGDGYELWKGATESVDAHAFDDTLTNDVRALVNHDTTLVLGRSKAGTLTLRADEYGLWGSVLINPDDQDAMNLYARVQRGDVSQCSFGFVILDEETEYREDGSVHWTIKKVELYEVSVVTFPAYKETEVQARREEFETMRKRRAEVWRHERLARLHAAKNNERM